MWPYIVLLFMGVFIILSFEQFLVMVIGFIFCSVGTAHLVYHMTVDEHFKL